MIKNEFFPTNQTIDGIEYTAYLSTLNPKKGFLDPYFMGYVEADKISIFQDNEVIFDTETKTLQGIVNNKQNLPWGYMIDFDQDFTSARFSLLGDNGIVKGANFYHNGLINSADTPKMNFTFQDGYYPQIMYRVFTTTTTTIDNELREIVNDMGLLYTWTFSTANNHRGGVLDFLDFLNGDYDLSVRLNNNDAAVPFNLKDRDLTKYVHEISPNKYIMFMGYSFFNMRLNNRRIFPFFKTKYPDFERIAYNLWSYGETDTGGAAIGNLVMDGNIITGFQMSTLYPTQTDVYSTGFNVSISGFTFTMPEISYLRGYTSWLLDKETKIPFTMGVSFPYTTLYGYYAMPVMDIKTIFMLANKLVDGAANESDTYDKNSSVSLFTSSNVPRYERVSDDYDKIESLLQPWQKGNLNENDFDSDEDIPDVDPDDPDDPDIPPEPEDLPDSSGDDQENQPDRVVPTPSKFITQYVLSASDVSAIGEKLWSSWLTTDTDIWKNFLFPLAKDTGSFNVTNALDYIVSLRVFPVDLINGGFVGFHNSNGVYMGTGHTNFLDKNVAILDSLVGGVYAGSVEVTPNDKESYGDFRDYYNTSVAVYLPYCGTVELNPVEVMFKTLDCYYYIDFQSGSCTAVLVLHSDTTYNIAMKSGQLGFLIPVTATNAGQLASQFIADSTSVAGMISGFYHDMQDASYKIAGVMAGANAAAAKGKSTDSFDLQGMSIQNDIQNSVMNLGYSLAGKANNLLSRSGIDIPMMSGGAGFDAFRLPAYPTLFIRRGKYSVPKNYPHTVGYRYTKSGKIGEITGFSVFENVDVSGLTCTEDEKNEIKALLESGVYIK